MARRRPRCASGACPARRNSTGVRMRLASVGSRLSGPLLIVILALALGSAAGLMAIRYALFLYLLYVIISPDRRGRRLHPRLDALCLADPGLTRTQSRSRG